MIDEDEQPLSAGAADLGDDEEEEREGPGLAGTAQLQPEDLKGALEALILVSDKPISIIVYGFDRFVSYAYVGGLNLNSLD